MGRGKTLKDIAKELNLSTATVSKAIKGYKDISDSTKERVLKLVELWNYTPNTMAINLRKSRTGIIGVIVPELVHHFFSEVISGIMEEAQKNGYLVVLFQSYETYKTEAQQCRLLQQYRVDGVLISLSNETQDCTHLEELQNEGIRVVQFDKVNHDFKASKVMIDDYQAAYDMTEYLIKKGRKNIAHIAGPVLPRNAKDRLKGYRDALLKNDYKYRQSWVYRTVDCNFEEGGEVAEKILKEHPKVDAIFCVNDMIAIGAMEHLKSKNIAIPEQIAVAGFSDWFMASVVSPSLTTVNQPGIEIGKRAVQVLVAEMESKEATKKQKVIVPTQLISRDSA